MVGLRTWISLIISLLALGACQPSALPNLQLIRVAPDSEIVEAQLNRSVPVRIRVQKNNGFNEAVQIAVEALTPPNSLGTASNQIGFSISPQDAQGNATITFEVRGQVVPNVYNLSIKATAASTSASLKLQLVVFRDRLTITATPDTIIQNDTPEPASILLTAKLASGVSGTIKWSLEGSSPGSLSGNTGESVNYIPPQGCATTARTVEVKATLEGGSNPGLADRKTLNLAPSNKGTIKITIGNIPPGLQPEVKVGGKPITGNSATLNLDAGIQPVEGKGLEEAGVWVDGFFNPETSAIEVKGCVNPDRTINYIKRGRKIWLAGSDGLRKLADNASLLEPANLAAGLFKAPSAAIMDKAGNLYVANRGNSTLTRFSVAALQSSNALPQYTLSSTAINEPTAVALDAAGNLWVANYGDNTLARFDRTALEPLGGASTLSPKPNLVVKGEGEVLRGLWGAAFNNAGDLFVSLFDQEELLRIPAAKLNGPSPVVIKENEVFRVENLTGPKGLAFDASGKLWVAEFTGGALIGVGNAFNQPLEAIQRHLSITILGKLNRNTPTEKPIEKFSNLAFDKEGQIWAVTETGTLARFKPPAASGVDIQSPSAAFSLTEPFGALALDVHPAGLPLNGRP
jgi:sugar lactone lactonase YvrE